MNRIIKFRAWDTEKKGWKGMWIFRGGHSGEYDVSNTEIDVLDLTNKWGSNVKVMQFTGLYDCEGKEIWEGDILVRSKNKNSAFKAVVEWHRGEFVGITVPYRNHAILLSKIQNMDGAEYNLVAGNIYENVELLD